MLAFGGNADARASIKQLGLEDELLLIRTFVTGWEEWRWCGTHSNSTEASQVSSRPKLVSK